MTGFIHAQSWLNDVREHADPHLTCILVGNKVDLCEGEAEGTSSRRREVSVDEAEKWAKKEPMLFLEASAKSGMNVESAFEQASRDILHKIKNGVFDDDRVSVITSQQNA
jgi:Ras-related protein Rab-2A